MNEEQISFDLNDRKQYLQSFMDQRPLYSYSRWMIFRPRGRFMLGIRTHDMGGTDYDYLEPVSYEDAKWLVSLPGVSEFLDCIKRYENDNEMRSVSGSL